VGSVRAGVFIFCLEVLALHEVAIADVERGFAEGAAVEVFRLDPLHVARIAWYFADIVLLLDGLELIVDLLGDMSA